MSVALLVDTLGECCLVVHTCSIVGSSSWDASDAVFQPANACIQSLLSLSAALCAALGVPVASPVLHITLAG